MLQQLNKKTLTRFQVSWRWLFSKIAILFPLSHSFLPHPLTQSAIPMRRPYSWGMGFMWSQRGWGVLSFPWILGPNGHSALAPVLAKAQAGSYWRSRALLAQAVSSNCVLGSWYFWGVSWKQHQLVAAWAVTRLQASGGAKCNICVSPAKQQGY